MAKEQSEENAQSPEVQAQYVRDDLDQEMITHTGEWRTGPLGTDKKGEMHHLGATDDEVVPVVPPMSGPADLIGEQDTNAQGNETGRTEVGEEELDPRDLLTPG